MSTGRMSGARLAVLHSRVDGLVRKMSNTLLRSGRSGVLNRAKDFSCCIVTADHQLLAAADSLPIHVLSGPDLMARTLCDFHRDLRRGDAFLHNSPYHGCSHPADHTLLVPVVDDAGVHRYTVLAKAHQADIGNSVPTTYHGTARDVYEEGALIFPCVRIQRDYTDIADIIRMCELRIRVPRQWRGDYLAMLGAARIGEAGLLELGRELGWDVLEQFSREWLDYSEACMAEAIAAVPAGSASGRSVHDSIPGIPAGGLAIRASVVVDPSLRTIDVDLRDNPDCLPCGLNLSEATARTAAMIGVFNSLPGPVPKNAGAFRRIRVMLREGCVAGVPRHPYSCSAATTNVADRVANAVQTAFATIADGIGMAEGGAAIAPSAGVVSGVDPRNVQEFINQVFLAFSAGPAAPHHDAWWTIGHVGNGGMSHIDGVELAELYQPIIVHRRGFVADTEGAGRTTGAPSTEVEFGPIGTSITVAYVSDGHENPAAGVRGGGAGGGADQWRVDTAGRRTRLPDVGQVEIAADERLIARSTGGGGYGSPDTRDPESVARDVREGLVSGARAREVYGVVVDRAGAVDVEATQALRAGPGWQR